MKLIFEKSVPGRRCTILPACDVESVSLPASLRRETKPTLPEMSETGISRHYTELCKQDLLYDPQTAGGLLMAVDPADADALYEELKGVVPSAQRIGTVAEYRGGKRLFLR